jgi:hypothetical protein
LPCDHNSAEVGVGPCASTEKSCDFAGDKSMSITMTPVKGAQFKPF